MQQAPPTAPASLGSLINRGSYAQRIAFLADTDYQTFLAREAAIQPFVPTPMERVACPLPSHFSPYAGHVGAQSKNTEIPAARCVCQNVLLSYHDSRCKP